MGIIAAAVWVGLLLEPRATGASRAKDWREGVSFSASAAELRAAWQEVPVESRNNVAVLWADAVYSLDGQGRATVRRRTVYGISQAARLEGSGWDTVRVGWAPWYQQRPTVRARSLSADGRFRELDPTTLSERPAERWDDVFSDARVLEAPLPALADGTIVEVETLVRDREPYFAAGAVYCELPLAAPYVMAGQLTVDAASNLPLHWKVEGAALIRSSERIEKRSRKLRFEYARLSFSERSELGAPSDQLREPSICFSTARDWESVAKAYASIVESKLNGAQLGTFLAGARKGLTREQAIDLALARIHQSVRYTGLELGSESIIPVRPEETLRRGYGDCKDQALLLVGALRHLGIAARVALLRPGWGRDVSEDVPGMGLFSHAIVMVPGQPTYWIDPTFKFCRRMDLPDAVLDRQALVAAGDTVGLVKIPIPASSPRGERQIREVFLAPVGKARVIETTEYSGVSEVEARQRHEGRLRKTLQEVYENYAKADFLNAKLDTFDAGSPADLQQPFRLRLEMSQSGRAVADSTEAVVAVMVADLFHYLPWGLARATEVSTADEEHRPEKRTQPFRIRRAVDASLHYQIHLPAGMIAREGPSKTQERMGPLTFTRVIEHPSADRVEVEMGLKVEPALITAAEYDEVVGRLRKFSEERALFIYFDQEVAKLLAAGSIKEALRLGRELVAQESHSPFRREQLAMALLAGGLGEAAQREAETATKLEPRSSLAFQVLGWMYQHDEIGRRFGAGFPRARAIEAYRKALELDANNQIAQGDLAILLEHDAHGRRYAPGLDLSEPIAIYRTLEARKTMPSLKNNLRIALLRASRSREALELLPREGLEPLGRQLRLTALVLERGVPAALVESRQSIPSTDQRVLTLRGAAFDLLSMGRLAEAGELVKAAAADAPNAAEMLRFAGVVEQASKFKAEAGSPEAKALEFFDGVMQADYVEAAGRRITPEIGELLGESLNAFLNAGAQVPVEIRAISRALNIEPALLMELGFRSAHYKREGDARFGYRVTIETQFGKASRSRVYLVPTPDGLRVAMLHHPVGAQGVVALKAIERGDEALARHWLDWAYQEDQDRSTNSVIRRLWAVGEKSREKILRAALALVVEAGAKADLVERLRETASGLGGSEQIGVELALARNAAARTNATALLAAVEKIAEQGFATPEIHYLKIAALEQLRRWEDIKQFGARLRADGSKEPFLESLDAMTEFHAGNIARGVAQVNELDGQGKVGPLELNEAAWATLFVPGYEEKGVAWAQRAAELTHYQMPNVLNTLAAIYAWQSKPREAYRLVVQTLDLMGEKKPSAADWVVMARISEDYGLPEEAKALYQRALAEDQRRVKSLALSTSRLVELQLERLKK